MGAQSMRVSGDGVTIQALQDRVARAQEGGQGQGQISPNHNL